MNTKNLLYVIIVVVVVIAGYYVLTMPDDRTLNQKVGDAVHDLNKGPDKAARQLESRTPGQKLGDDIKDAGDGVKNSTAADPHQ